MGTFDAIEAFDVIEDSQGRLLRRNSIANAAFDNES